MKLAFVAMPEVIAMYSLIMLLKIWRKDLVCILAAGQTYLIAIAATSASLTIHFTTVARELFQTMFVMDHLPSGRDKADSKDLYPCLRAEILKFPAAYWKKTY